MSAGSGGGGVRDIGTVTAGMAIMNFDEKTKPYSREDFIAFLMNYKENLNDEEKRLVEKGMLGTFVGMPLAFALGYGLSGRFGWHRVVSAMTSPPTVSASASAASSASASPTSPTASSGNFAPQTHASSAAAAAGGDKWARRIPYMGRTAFGLAAATIPYLIVQQWFVSTVLELDERRSNLSFHVRRLMLAQRSGMMFKRTATREVTREEQQALMAAAADTVTENRSGRRVEQGLGTGAPDVNMQLGGQVLTPIAQTGYKAMPK